MTQLERDDAGFSDVLPGLKMAPLAERAREILIDAILEDRFPDGRLPPEPELARQLGVSRTTVREALNQIQALGLIDRTRGAGTVVLSHTGAQVLALSGLISFSRLLAARGHKVDFQAVIGVDEQVPADVVDRLEVDPAHEPLYLFRVLLFADGTPALSTSARFRTTELSTPPARIELPASILDLSASWFRDPIDHAVAEIVPVVAGRDRYEDLDVEEGDPLVLLRETHYTSTHRPVGTSDVLIDPHHLLLSVFRRVPRKAI